MLKHLILLGLASVLQSLVWAQQFPRQVLASAGNISTSGNISLSWTLGQPGPVQSTSPSSFYLTQGFQQGDEWWVSISNTIRNYDGIKAYPNPSSGIIHLEGTLPAGGPCRFEMLDINGRISAEVNLSTSASGIINEVISFPDLAEGTYTLRLSGGTETSPYICTRKIIVIKK
jgi:hypothetical protein